MGTDRSPDPAAVVSDRPGTRQFLIQTGFERVATVTSTVEEAMAVLAVPSLG